MGDPTRNNVAVGNRVASAASFNSYRAQEAGARYAQIPFHRGTMWRWASTRVKALFDRLTIDPHSELFMRADGMLQSGPDPKSDTAQATPAPKRVA